MINKFFFWLFVGVAVVSIAVIPFVFIDDCPLSSKFGFTAISLINAIAATTFAMLAKDEIDNE